MNCKRIFGMLVVVALFVLTASGLFVSPSSSTRAAPAPSADASFRGKVLLVSTGAMSVFVLEKAQVQRLGERSWLTGKGALEGRMGGWYKGRTMWLRMDHINFITAFDDVQDAKKALESGAGMPFGVVGGPMTLPAYGGGYGGSVPSDSPKKAK